MERPSSQVEIGDLKNLDLRKKLDETLADKYREGQRSIEAEIEKREFRDAILGLVSELRDGIVKRLGFIPASTQAEINSFITLLATSEKNDHKKQGDDDAEFQPPPPPSPGRGAPSPPLSPAARA